MQNIHTWPEEKRKIVFWLVLAACAFILILLWLVFGFLAPDPDTSDSQLKADYQAGQQYWQEQLQSK